jgi:hypothetical protein
MAAAVDLEARALDDLRAGPAAFGGALGLAGGDVDPGERGGGRGDALARGGDFGHQRLEMRFLGGERVAAGFGDAARLLVQVERVEAHRAGHRLAVGEAAIRGHQGIGVAARDFDEVAEHPVVADLERGDAGLGAVARLERGDRAAGAARGLAQFVESVVVAFGNEPALRPLGRRRRHQRARQVIGQRAVSGERRQQAPQQRREIALGLQEIVQPARSRESVANLPEVARRAAPGDEPAERAAEIGQRAEHLAHVGAQ